MNPISGEGRLVFLVVSGTATPRRQRPGLAAFHDGVGKAPHPFGPGEGVNGPDGLDHAVSGIVVVAEAGPTVPAGGARKPGFPGQNPLSARRPRGNAGHFGPDPQRGALRLPLFRGALRVGEEAYLLTPNRVAELVGQRGGNRVHSPGQLIGGLSEVGAGRHHQRGGHRCLVRPCVSLGGKLVSVFVLQRQPRRRVAQSQRHRRLIPGVGVRVGLGELQDDLPIRIRGHGVGGRGGVVPDRGHLFHGHPLAFVGHRLAVLIGNLNGHRDLLPEGGTGLPFLQTVGHQRLAGRLGKPDRKLGRRGVIGIELVVPVPRPRPHCHIRVRNLHGEIGQIPRCVGGTVPHIHLARRLPDAPHPSHIRRIAHTIVLEGVVRISRTEQIHRGVRHRLEIHIPHRHNQHHVGLPQHHIRLPLNGHPRRTGRRMRKRPSDKRGHLPPRHQPRRIKQMIPHPLRHPQLVNTVNRVIGVQRHRIYIGEHIEIVRFHLRILLGFPPERPRTRSGLR